MILATFLEIKIISKIIFGHLIKCKHNYESESRILVMIYDIIPI